MAASPISTKGGDAGRSLTFLSSSMSKGILNMNNEKEVLFSVSHLKKYFQVGKNATLKAVDDVSFEIYKGETLGMVGESGCGKTTCGRTCIGLYSRTDGEVLFKGKDPQKLTGKEKQNYKKSVQMVFQDPYGSLDPRMPELLTRDWYVDVDVSKYAAYFVVALNHDMSVSSIIDPHIIV